MPKKHTCYPGITWTVGWTCAICGKFYSFFDGDIYVRVCEYGNDDGYKERIKSPNT